MAKKQSFTGELLHHVGLGVRVTGSGILQSSLVSLDSVNIQNLAPYTMIPTTNRQEILLANFTDQYGSAKFYTQNIDETFEICKIVFYVRPNSAEYPR